jgi:hypothetical protein
MGQLATWVSEGPDTMQLEAVLSGGLHDELHEDEIEDMRRRGVAVPKPSVVRSQDSITGSLPVAVSKTVVPDTKNWFAQYYPKLQPQDLAEFYRERYLAPEAPIRSGSVDAFDKYRKLLAARVKNANINDDLAPEMAENTRQKNLNIAPEMLAHHRAVAITRRDNGLPRTSIIALLTCFSLAFGGIVGMGIANSDELSGMLSVKNAAIRLQTLLPAALRK